MKVITTRTEDRTKGVVNDLIKHFLDDGIKNGYSGITCDEDDNYYLSLKSSAILHHWCLDIADEGFFENFADEHAELKENKDFTFENFRDTLIDIVNDIMFDITIMVLEDDPIKRIIFTEFEDAEREQ